VVLPRDVDALRHRRVLLLLGDRGAQRGVDAGDAGDPGAEQRAAQEQGSDRQCATEEQHGRQ
jgi:hypothetical protein